MRWDFEFVSAKRVGLFIFPERSLRRKSWEIRRLSKTRGDESRGELDHNRVDDEEQKVKPTKMIDIDFICALLVDPFDFHFYSLYYVMIWF